MLGDKQKTYPAHPDVDAALLARGVEAFLVMQEGMSCQILQTPVGYTVQTRKREDWKKFAMQDQALAVEITESGNFISVKSGQQKWVSKSVVGVAGAFLIWPIGLPMMALASAGQVTQLSLIKKIMAFIDMFMMTGGTNIRIPEPEEIAAAQAGFAGPPQGMMGQAAGMSMPSGARLASPVMSRSRLVCGQCGAALTKDQRFCPACGESTAPKKNLCAACGAELADGQRFCPDCGASTAPKKIFCKSCGAEVSPGQKFCSACGLTVKEEED